MQTPTHVKTPHASVVQIQRPQSRRSIVPLHAAVSLQRRSGVKPVSSRALQVCAAASFSSGSSGNAEFPKAGQEVNSDAGTGSGATGLKVATYIFLW